MANAVQQAVGPKVTALAEPLAQSMGLELVDVDYLREGPAWVLRIYLDKPGGVTLDDCSDFSRALGPALDVDDVVGTAYSLEVSSPGLERPLKRQRDFERFAGKTVKVKTFAPLGKAGEAAARSPGKAPRKNFQGTLKGFTDGAVDLEVDGQPLSIPLSAIAKANLVVDL